VVTVVFVKLPQALPEHPVPETLQVTPLPLESFATVAVKFTVCVISMLVWLAGASKTEIAGGVEVFSPSPPQLHKRNKADKIKTSLFMMTFPPEESQEMVL
jgi:hypothetical protein